MGLNNPISAAAVLPTSIRLVVLVGPFMAAVSLRMAVVLTWQVHRMVTTITAPPVLKDKPRSVGRKTQILRSLKRVKELQSYKRICFFRQLALQFPEIFS
jgi:hypothetical protein